VPVYNSAEVLGKLVERLEPVLRSLQRPFELVLVNDGSRDRSWDAIRAVAARHPAVRGVDLTRNFGQHNALLAGIRRARHEIVVTMDDDLQHPPAEIPRLVDALASSYDVVYGAPAQEQHGFWRDVASVLTKLALQAAMDIRMARASSAFRAFRAQILAPYRDFDGPFVDVDALLGWTTERFGVVTVPHGPRYAGSSNYSFRSLVRHAVNMVTCYSVLPLRLASLAGFAFTLFGVGVLAWVLGRYLLEGGTPEGFPFLASIIAIFSGAQLFASGMIGEYLARTHFRSMGRPGSVVRETTDDVAALG